MSSISVDQVAEYVSQGRCALFVGPDISESAGGYRGLPTSWQMADELASRCNYRGRFRSLPQIAQIFQNELGRASLIDYLRDRLGAPDYQPLPVHEVIARISFPIIVHGGWDVLLERTLQSQQIPFRLVRSNTDLPYLLQGERQLLVYKPYGSVEEATSLLVTEDDQLRMFYDLQLVIEQLKSVMGQYVLLLVGYAPAQDTAFVRLYYEIRRLIAEHRPLAVAVQSLARVEDAAAWEARGVKVVTEDPASFLWRLAKAVALAQGRAWTLPEPAMLSSAPRLTLAEVSKQGDVLNRMMDQIGVADLVEQTNVPLLAEEQLRDIEAMRATYERLAESLAAAPGSARVWLRQGNLEYARENCGRAGEYYRRALALEPQLAEAYHNLHYIQLALSDWSGAMQSYQQAIALQPELAILPARYQIEAVLGGGGVGVVYRARDTQTGQMVAIKVLQRAKAQTEQILNVFKREAHILQSLAHPHIVRMLDFQSYRGNYFIVMEYLEGQSLKALLHKSQPFKLDQAFEMIEQVSDALEYAHTHGIIHRDVKPSNIFLTGGQAKLIDFGLARSLALGEATLGTVAGTMTYLSPEQALGQPTDQRTDVYGLATVFYELLTGRNPSQGTYRPPSELLPGLNNAFDLVIEKAREQDVNDRYPTVAAFLNDLRPVVAMQAASEDAPLALRLTARAAQLAKTTVERGWPVWLGVIVCLGFILPAFASQAVVFSDLGRYGAVGLAIVLLSGVVAGPLTLVLARRVREAAIAAYGPAMGVLLGIANSVLWLRSFRFVYINVPQPDFPSPRLGDVPLEKYLIVLISSLVLSLGVTVLSFLVPQVIGVRARRWHTSGTRAFFLVFLLWIGVLLVAGLSLHSWFAEVRVLYRP